MELRHLRYFCAVADHGTFSEAGRQLHVSQSAISEQIADLEREVGGALLNRTSGGRVSLRTASCSLRKRARHSLPPTAPSKSPTLDPRPVGSLSIGFFLWGREASLRASSVNTASFIPNIKLSLYEMRTPEQMEALTDRQDRCRLCAAAGTALRPHPARRASLSRSRRGRVASQSSSGRKAYLHRCSGRRTVRPVRSADDACTL